MTRRQTGTLCKVDWWCQLWHKPWDRSRWAYATKLAVIASDTIVILSTKHAQNNAALRGPKIEHFVLVSSPMGAMFGWIDDECLRNIVVP